MTLQKAIILAIMQGVTEFLPISSSGHLVLTRSLIGVSDVPILFDLILHLGTVTATVVVYYRKIWEILRDLGRRGEAARGNTRLFLYIIVSTVITALVGFLFKGTIVGLFQNPSAVSAFLIVTGVILFATRYAQKGTRQIDEARIHVPFVIGFVQSFAMLPGISRSGSTISAGLFMGLDRELSASYSFLLSIPSVFGAVLFEYMRSHQYLYQGTSLAVVIVAFLFSLVSGYAALRILLKFVQGGRLWIFSFYCFVVAALGLILL
ncbi:MAG TPA: undecaprenyl-diphosphate phosphatase [Spirochaetota bacterium]|nr:undecaprenyl-diphosphate phosphatase [Spirochaetota bacterium]